MQVLVRGAGDTVQSTPLKDVLDLLFSQSALVWLGVALIIVLISCPFDLDARSRERRRRGSSRKYFPGIFQALNWTTTALVSHVQLQPAQWLARVLGILWMFDGVVFIALYTAQLTATLTTDRFEAPSTGLPTRRESVSPRSWTAPP